MFDVVFLRGLCIISLPIIRLVVDTEGEKDSLFKNSHRKSIIVSKPGYPCDRVYSAREYVLYISPTARDSSEL